jgi:hypothetical protein
MKNPYFTVNTYQTPPADKYERLLLSFDRMVGRIVELKNKGYIDVESMGYALGIRETLPDKSV